MKKKFKLDEVDCANCAAKMEDAIRKMQAALCEMVIEGVNHNAQMHIDLLSEPAFRNGSYTTDYLTKRNQ